MRMNTTRFFEFSPSGRNRCRHVADKPFHVLLPNQRLHCPSGRMLSKALPTITDLAPLRGARVALVADDDNIRISTQRHRRRFSYRTLLERMGKEARVVAALAVVTAVPGDQGRQHYLETRGWRTLVLPREMCAGVNGLRLRSNADLDLCLEVGCWLAAVSFDVLAVVSGDGDLCVSIARAAARHRPDVRVVTLAIPSSASQQLRTRRDLFHAHVALGRDLTRPFDREL